MFIKVEQGGVLVLVRREGLSQVELRGAGLIYTKGLFFSEIVLLLIQRPWLIDKGKFLHQLIQTVLYLRNFLMFTVARTVHLIELLWILCLYRVVLGMKTITGRVRGEFMASLIQTYWKSSWGSGIDRRV